MRNARVASVVPYAVPEGLNADSAYIASEGVVESAVVVRVYLTRYASVSTA
jgi:hypothetical protein